MATAISNIQQPELYFGFVSAIGVDLKPTLAAFRNFLEREGYTVIDLRVSDSFDFLKDVVAPKKKLVQRQHLRVCPERSYRIA
jgi:hypothetical protein